MGKYNKTDNDEYLLRNNLLGIHSMKELEKAETLAFSLRAAELEHENSQVLFTLEGFKDLHYYLFQDIYSFAGQFRDVQLAKGGTRFCQVQYLNDYATNLFKELHDEPTWQSIEEAAERLAYFKSELNMLHPFREGNGRTTRVFINEFALSRGIIWTYETMEPENYMQAMKQSVPDLTALYQLFLDTIRFVK